MNDIYRGRWSAYRQYRSVALFGYEKHDAVHDAVLQPVSFNTVLVDTTIAQLADEPSMQLSIESVQALMDELWSIGIRPSGRPDPQPQIEAMQAHIRDLQRLVFERGMADPNFGQHKIGE